jgi:hypothetical protein
MNLKKSIYRAKNCFYTSLRENSGKKSVTIEVKGKLKSRKLGLITSLLKNFIYSKDSAS